MTKRTKDVVGTTVAGTSATLASLASPRVRVTLAMFPILATLAIAGSAGPLAAQDVGDAGARAEVRETQDASAELEAIARADQDDRSFTEPPSPEEWEEIAARDEERRNRVMELVRAGALSTADDYFNAALVLQHGQGSEDILIAHILATVAGFRGHEGGPWLSAAALDRYLHRTDEPQRLGTQYLRQRADASWGMGAYEDWLPDSIREAYDVPPLEEQLERLERMNEDAGSGG